MVPEPPVPPKIEAKPPEPKKVEAKKPTPPKPKAAPRAAPLSSSNVVAERPKVRYRPPLRFPEKAKRRGIEGQLMLEVRVDNRGNVAGISIKKSSGHRILDSEAVSAVKSWKFEPAKNAAGRAVATTIAVPVKFGYADAE
ncbi:MAG: energy transducer TonB [bacterium]|nr:energy transducer TonB [bacterium]